MVLEKVCDTCLWGLGIHAKLNVPAYPYDIDNKAKIKDCPTCKGNGSKKKKSDCVGDCGPIE